MQGRAIVGVIALYALFLQAFFGALAPLRALPAFPGATLCAQDVPDDPAPAHRDGLNHACCIVAQAATLGQPPETAFTALTPRWSDRAPALWRAVEVNGARAPPDQSASPRGPPTA